ncbi:hypothetical protein D3C81_1696920 [compost metagenome]
MGRAERARHGSARAHHRLILIRSNCADLSLFCAEPKPYSALAHSSTERSPWTLSAERFRYEHNDFRTGVRLPGRAPVCRDDRGLGRRRHGHGGVHRLATGLARPQLRPRMDQLRAPAPTAHQPGDLRLRRLRAVRHLLLHGTAHLPYPSVRRPADRLHLLGLAGGDRHHAGQPAAGLHHHQGVRRD